MESLLDVAFIVATVAFFKRQFELSGKTSILAALIVSLIVGLAPTIADQFPSISPWITQAVNVLVLFIAAAGSVDAIKQFRK